MTRAVQVSAVGGPESLRVEPVEVGPPGPGQARVRQTVAGINYIDVYHRTGLYPQTLPFVPGIEGAGVVEKLGEGATEVAVGDRVAYAGILGGYCDVRNIAADRLVPIPDGVSDETAAAAMLQGLTARALLKEVYPVKAGETILVHAAAGGTGLLVCQWARALGATVIGTVSTDEKAELAQAHGCEHAIVTGRHDFVEATLRITGGAKLPVVYDSVGRDTFMRSLDCLRRRGMMVSFGQASGAIPPLDIGLLARKGSLYLTRPIVFTFIDERHELVAAAEDLFGMILSGRIKVRVNQRYRLEDVGEAHRDLEARRTMGSSVLVM